MTPSPGRDGDAAGSGRIGILRLQHVGVPFPGSPEAVAQARRFYGDLLGLEEIPVPPTLPGTILWFRVGDQEFHIFSEESSVSVNAQSRRHPCLEVEDVVALRAHLDAAGVATRDHDGGDPRAPALLRPGSVR